MTGLSAKTLWWAYRQVNIRRWGLMRNERTLDVARLDHYGQFSNKLYNALTAKLDADAAERDALRLQLQRLGVQPKGAQEDGDG